MSHGAGPHNPKSPTHFSQTGNSFSGALPPLAVLLGPSYTLGALSPDVGDDVPYPVPPRPLPRPAPSPPPALAPSHLY